MPKPRIQEEQVVVRMPRMLRDELRREARGKSRPLTDHIRQILILHAAAEMTARNKTESAARPPEQEYRR
jgi:hypothetical protein